MRDIFLKKGRAKDRGIYNKEYYLSIFDGYENYIKQEGKIPRDKLYRSLDFSQLRSGEKVLDIGCGRGELAYQCALRGCKVVAVDFSKEAVALTQQTISHLPEELRQNVSILQMDVSELNLADKFDVIFLIDVVGHLYDEQLKVLFKNVKKILNKNGRLIIQTPNLNYIRFLYPLKHILSLPTTIIKQILRVLRKKRKEKNIKDWLKNTFKISFPLTEIYIKMHVNEHTPGHLKQLLSDFDTKIFCYDHSKNPISLIFKKWWGREIIVIARVGKTVSPMSSA
jgi:2-polyprenyl-3-methyl-5-hydroxy-6-metoxy-1,4-benzoquinol methylase